MAKALMIQGTGSNVGKSVLVAGLCRALTQLGHRVRPFKPQNMSNNAAAIPGGEISRAQALQARACRTDPTVDMNPILLKPEGESGAQVIVLGRKYATLSAKEYFAHKPELLNSVIASYHRVAKDADIVIVEGAGSPAEINLRDGDIANMGFATEVSIPVVLVADIERGGTIAQLVGTKEVIGEFDSALIRGFAVNKFRGDPDLFTEGVKFIEEKTGWKSLGVVPWFDKARMLPAEDAQDLANIKPLGGPTKIVCLKLPRIANFDDLDPLRMEPDLSVSLLEPGCSLPGDVDLVIIPGTKATMHDLEFLRKQGWDVDLHAHVRRGGAVLGICGGYQMLGRFVSDPLGVEGTPGQIEGLGLLDAKTVMTKEKRVTPVTAADESGKYPFNAYEIHMGRTSGPDLQRPFAQVKTNGAFEPEGAVSENGRVFGTYLHGLFADDLTRSRFLSRLGMEPSRLNYEASVETTLDALANHLRTHLDIKRLLALMEG